jgi:putative Holliday junction resolvase
MSTGEVAPSERVVAIDLGERRIGVAVSDSSQTMAFPRPALLRGGDPQADHASIERLVLEEEAGTLVVGLPLSLNGSMGPAAQKADAEAEVLRARLAERHVDVVTFDERLTTVSAQAALHHAGKRGRLAREVVDSAAATVLLQTWLDAK